MSRGEVDVVVVGTDRVAANGDVANKIGTYMVAVLAHRHGIPFYVACPLSTIDLALPDGPKYDSVQRPILIGSGRNAPGPYFSQPRRRKYHMGTRALATMSASAYG